MHWKFDTFFFVNKVSFMLCTVCVGMSVLDVEISPWSGAFVSGWCRTYWLGPEAGNVHYLEALEDCCFFDVVSPPYSPQEGRDCT